MEYFRARHHAIVVAVIRGGKAHVNPDVGFALAEGDELVVIALDEPQL